MINRGPSSRRLPTVLGIVGTTAAILPVFLTGAVAVQIREAIELSESDIGLAIGAFFAGSAIGSSVLGRWAEKLGARLAILLGLAGTIVADLAIATLVDGPRLLQGILIVAGFANSLTQPAINLLLVRTIERERLGFAMALKQSGMPMASLLGGLAVPLIALTVGWEATFVLGAVLALGAIALTMALNAEPSLDPDANAASADNNKPSAAVRSSKPDLSWTILLLMAAVGVLAGGSANILVGYMVSGSVDAGIGQGAAGLLLTVGSALGICSRLVHGWRVDRGSFDALSRVIVLLGLGAVGALGLAIHLPLSYVAVTPLVFAAGWAWPGLFNLVVVNANRSAPAAATGITQTGVYAGSVFSPIAAGLLIERYDYWAAWLLTAVALAGATCIASIVKRQLRDRNGGESQPSNGVSNGDSLRSRASTRLDVEEHR